MRSSTTAGTITPAPPRTAPAELFSRAKKSSRVGPTGPKLAQNPLCNLKLVQRQGLAHRGKGLQNLYSGVRFPPAPPTTYLINQAFRANLPVCPRRPKNALSAAPTAPKLPRKLPRPSKGLANLCLTTS